MATSKGDAAPEMEALTCAMCGLSYYQRADAARKDCPRCGVRPGGQLYLTIPVSDELQGEQDEEAQRAELGRLAHEAMQAVHEAEPSSPAS